MAAYPGVPDYVWNPTTGSDTTGTGSLANPYQTMNKASTIGGANSHIGCMGLQITALGSATWTQDSKSVVFTGVDLTGTLVAGTFIRVSPATLATALIPCYRVSSSAYAGGDTTATLTRFFRGDTTTAATELIPKHTAITANETLANTGHTVSFGWKSDGTLPSDYVSAITGTAGSSYNITFGKTGTTVQSNGRFFVLWDTAGNDRALYTYQGSGRIYGVMDTNGGSYGSFEIRGGAWVFDTVISSYGAGGGVNVWESGRAYGRKLIVHNGKAFYSTATNVHDVFIDVIEEYGGGTTGIWGNGGLKVASHSILHNTGNQALGHANPSTAPFRIGTLTNEGATLTYTGHFQVGSSAVWRSQTHKGVTDRVEGKGGSPDMGWRIDPSSAYFPHYEDIFETLITASGQTVILTFDCYYSGTAADVPPCEILLLDSNGLTADVYTFTPANGTSWTDSTQKTVTFSSTTMQAGTLRWLLRVRDNAAGDAVLYLDNLKVSAGGSTELSNLDTGLGMYYGLENIIMDIPAAGSGGGGLLVPDFYGVQ